MRAAALPSHNKMYHDLFTRSLELMSSTLKRDMYSLGKPGFLIDEADTPNPDPLATVRYSCVYWIDHLYDSKPRSWVKSVGDLKVGGAIEEFMKKKYLYWLEGLSLCRSIGKGVISMGKLCSLVQVRHTKMIQLYNSPSIYADSSRRCTMRVSLLSLLKMPVDLSCTTKR
jgi:hypothetical protein